MKRIFVPTRDGTDWQRLLAKPTLHWKMGASAMTAAASWEDASGELPAEISSLLSRTSEPSLVDLSLLAALPEWQVALPGGDTTSNTDVLAICRNESGVCIVAVEAKVLEDFGPLLKDKRAGASPNQERRLAYLHELLGVSAFDDAIRYQLLHRTASALLTAQQFHAHCAVMLVHGTPAPETVGLHRLLRRHGLDGSHYRRLARCVECGAYSVLGLVRRGLQVPFRGVAENGDCGHVAGAN